MKSPSALMLVAGVALVLWALFAEKADGTSWMGSLVPSAVPEGDAEND